MRIIGGARKGMVLSSPDDKSIRPTTDRVKENVFNILEHNFIDHDWENIRVLDLCAGTGALGLEALSRGAKFCVFIDNAPHASSLIRNHLHKMKAESTAKILRRDVTKLGHSDNNTGKFQLVFADPPYGKNLAPILLSQLVDHDWLEDQAIIVLEETPKLPAPEHPTLTQESTRKYGESQIMIYRFTPFSL